MYFFFGYFTWIFLIAEISVHYYINHIKYIVFCHNFFFFFEGSVFKTIPELMILWNDISTNYI